IGLVPEVSITVTNDPEDTTPTFSGTSDNTVGDLTLTVNGVEYAVTPELDGSWEFTLPDGAALADGEYTATIDGVDAQGDAAETSDADFTIGLVPEVSITVTNDPEDTTPTFSGTSDNTVGDLTLTVNGVEYAVTPELDGSWEFTLPDGAALADGDYTATIDGVDAQGDAAETSEVDFEIATPPDTISINVIAGDDVVDDSEDRAVSINGTTSGIEEGQRVNVTITDDQDSEVYTGKAIVDENGNWEILDADLSGLPEDASYTATATTNDALGNDPIESTRDFTTLDSNRAPTAEDDIGFVIETFRFGQAGDGDETFVSWKDAVDDGTITAGSGIDGVSASAHITSQGGMPVIGVKSNDKYGGPAAGQIEYRSDNSNGAESGTSEFLSVNLGGMTTSASFGFRNMYYNEQGKSIEQGVWKAYLNGEEVASDTFYAKYGKSEGDVNIDLGGLFFDEIRFEAAEYVKGAADDGKDSSDYYVKYVEADVIQGGLITTEDSPFLIEPSLLLDNDTDLDGDSLEIIGFTQPEKGTITQNPDGSFEYDPNGEFDDLELGEGEKDTFTYTITDEFGNEVTGTVTVEVVGLSDTQAPQVNALFVDELLETPNELDDMLPGQDPVPANAGAGGQGSGGESLPEIKVDVDI
ncbi:Ig-like domain-containing protein, partial [Echinimonas agarilytica]